MTVKAVWHIVKESAKCIAFGARLSSNHRTVPWVQAANSISRQ
jgi:hypothetical protein